VTRRRFLADDGGPAEVHTLLPERQQLRNGLPVVDVGLGVTAYLDDPASWAAEGVGQAWKFYSELTSSDSPCWYTTSSSTVWERCPSRDRVAELVSSRHLLLDRPAHFYRIQIGDSPLLPEVSFDYQQVDPSRASRSSVLQITLRRQHRPEELLQLCRALLALGPVRSLTAGFSARWNPAQAELAFSRLYFWAKRFLGFDIPAPDHFAWHNSPGLPGLGWASFLPAGDPVLKAVPDSALPGQLEPVRGGRLLILGGAPDLLDVNQLKFPGSYFAAGGALAEAFAPPPPTFAGAFDTRSTQAWFRRFVDPGGWTGG
jgi:hypothetical protein